MKPRTLLILTVLALGLGAFIFFVERDLPTTDERRQRDKKVLDLEAEDVTAVVLTWDDQEVRLEKQAAEKGEHDEGEEGFSASDDTWLMRAPLESRADAAQVSSLINRLVGLEKSRTLEDIDLDELGLTTPRATALLVTQDGEHRLRVGTELPLSSSVVLQGDDGDVAYKVENAADLVDELTREPGDWRDKQLFTAERADIDRITLETGDQRLLLARRGDVEAFWLESPVVDRADGEAVSGLLTSLTSLQAKSFVDQVPEGVELGFGDQAIVLVLRGEQTPWTLELGHVVDGVLETSTTRYARLGGQLIELEASRLDDPLSKAVHDWRSRAWSSLQVFKIDHASFELDGQAIALTRDAGDWLRGEHKIAYNTASDALYPLSEMRAERLVDRRAAEEEGHSLTDPRLEVVLTASDGAEETLSLFNTTGDLAAATTEGRDAVLLLAAEEAEKLVDKVIALRDAEPLPDEEPDEGAAPE